MMFLSPEVALYLNKSTIRSCMEYCCHVQLVLLVATWNCWISYKNGYPGLFVLHLLPLSNPWLIVEMYLAYYSGRCSSELAQLVPFPYSRGRSTPYSDRLHDFSVTITRCYKDVYVKSFFPRTARLWYSLPIECFPLTYDRSGFKSRMNRYLLTVSSF